MLLLHIWAVFNWVFHCRLDPEKLVDVVVFFDHLGWNNSLIKDFGLLSSHARENAVEAKQPALESAGFPDTVQAFP